MEDENEEISVQLYQDPNELKESFDNLNGKPGDKPQRMTMLSLDYNGDTVEASTKLLPVLSDKADEADMYVLGKGPTKFKEGWEDEVREAFKGLKK